MVAYYIELKLKPYVIYMRTFENVDGWDKVGTGTYVQLPLLDSFPDLTYNESHWFHNTSMYIIDRYLFVVIITLKCSKDVDLALSTLKDKLLAGNQVQVSYTMSDVSNRISSL